MGALCLQWTPGATGERAVGEEGSQPSGLAIYPNPSTLVPGATHPGRRAGSGSPKAPLAPQAWMDTVHAHSQGRCVRNGGLDADSNFSLGGPAMPLKPGFPVSPAAPDTADGQRSGF